jgi:SAM-dependent methyltransferase
MCVIQDNFHEMEDVVELAARAGAGNVHFMWGFGRGRAKGAWPTEPEAAFEHLRRAFRKARRLGVSVDNIETLRAQVFSPVGTRYDGSVAGWESIAVGPDGKVYPTPATVGIRELGFEMNGDLSKAWQENPILEGLRQASVRSEDMPLKYLLGGGDFDHRYVFSGELTGRDPYYPLYLKLVLWLITQEAAAQADDGPPALRLKMGEVLESCGPHGAVALVHNNCLLSVADAKGHRPVASFYADAAQTPNQEILNPVRYPKTLVDHISDEHLVRRYGCGSPVLDARLQAGERVLDLGCGGGVECFIAARLVGKGGRVIGLDMLGEMLSLAVHGTAAVGKQLGYFNVAFCGGKLEDLPLATGVFDVVISNCVINLSINKRKVFREISRVLKRGGRVVISDVVCETEPGPEIRNDDILKGQCLAGAMVQQDLFGLMEESGLISTRVLGRFPYRTVKCHPFYSLTFEAYKPRMAERVRVMYRGPHASVVTHYGTVLNAGMVQEVWRDEIQACGDDILAFDENGAVLNPGVMSGCACSCEDMKASDISKEGGAVSSNTTVGNPHAAHDARIGIAQRHQVDCMVCGGPLTYTTIEAKRVCAICGTMGSSNAFCLNDHYVCDECHKAAAQMLVERICLLSLETDMVALMQAIRSHAFFPVHGPEHHGMVAGVVLSTYRNLGGKMTDDAIRLGIQRGGRVSGGACAFMGACGGALGVGIAFGLILESSPVKAEARQIVQQATKEALAKIASFKAARCCQRDTWLGLRTAAELSNRYLAIPLLADAPLECAQFMRNRECIGRTCPLYPNT